MPWQALTICCDSERAMALSDLLSDAGAVSVSLTDGVGEAVIEDLPGGTPLWRETEVRGLFAAEAALDGLITRLRQAGYPTPDVAELNDLDWEHAWRQQVRPQRFGERLWVLPSFVETSNEQQTCIRLDPGLAFGTGSHPTTALCLEWLERTIRPGNTAIDFGCGSGILAIAAIKLGAAYAIGVDTDPQALSTARENAVANACDGQIDFYAPQSLPQREFDVLVANIFANPLIALRQEFAARVRPGGQLALSGILAAQADAVVEAYAELFILDPPETREEWSRISGRRRPHRSE